MNFDMNVDFSKIVENIKNYFSSLNDKEKYAYIGIAIGIVLIIASFVIW